MDPAMATLLARSSSFSEISGLKTPFKRSCDIEDEIANNKKKLANNKKIKYHQNKIKKLDKVQRDLQANFADAQNDLAAAQATAQFTTDVSIRNQAEKAQRLIQNDIEKIQSTMADNEANLAKYNVDIGKYQADTEHRKKTDPEFKKSYEEAGEFIDSLGKYGEADYAKPILAFLKKNKGKKFFVKEIKAKLNATTPFTKKYKCLKFGISLTETKDACSYLWTRDKIEKTGNHKYYLED